MDMVASRIELGNQRESLPMLAEVVELGLHPVRYLSQVTVEETILTLQGQVGGIETASRQQSRYHPRTCRPANLHHFDVRAVAQTLNQPRGQCRRQPRGLCNGC